MLNKKQNLKSGTKAKIRKGDLKEKRREETNKNEKGLMNKNFVIEYFDVVLFMKQKQRRNQKKERDKKQETKRNQKKKRQEGRQKEKKKRERERERDRERDRERKSESEGGQKRLWRKNGRHSNINKKSSF